MSTRIERLRAIPSTDLTREQLARPAWITWRRPTAYPATLERHGEPNREAVPVRADTLAQLWRAVREEQGR